SVVRAKAAVRGPTDSFHALTMVLRKDKGAYESSAIFVEAFGSFHIDFYQDDSEDNVEDAYGFEDGMGDADESLSPLQRLERYLDSDNIFNRQMVARSMLDTLRAVGDDKGSCTAVLDAMVRLSQDTDPSVRSELMEQVPHIAVYCQENKGLFSDAMPNYILPMVVRYLNDANNQVRKTSQAALLVLLEQGLVDKEDIEHQVVNVILELASPSSLDDYRTEAVALMSKMAPLLGRDITERLFLPRFCEMLTDPLFHVRKVCASNFGEVCNVVGVQNSEEILLPKFYYLCEDGVWGVRKACAECFMTISCACSLETRRRHLANLFVNLLSDQSRWVRMSAFQQLGPFISTFADPHLTGLYVNEDGTIIASEVENSVGNAQHSDENQQDVLALTTSPVEEARLHEDDEMDVVLSEIDDEGAGEMLGGGRLMIPLSDSEVSPEEKRAGLAEPPHSDGKEDAAKKEGASDPEVTKEELPSVMDKDGEHIAEGMSRLGMGDEETPEKSSELQPAEPREESKENVDNENVESSSIASDNSSCDTCTENNTEPGGEDDTRSISTSVLSTAGSDSECSVPFSTAATQGSSVYSSASDKACGDRVHVHLDNSNFNTFQYWRSPLPEVDIDFDVINGAPANIHVVAKVKDGEKHKVYKTHMDVVVSPSDTSHSGSVTQVTDGSSVQRRDMELGGVTIHTASVSTVSDADEETVDNIGSTHVLGHSLGQPTLAVVDGVVKADLSSGSISYMDSDFSPINHVDDAELAQQQDIVPQSLLENYLGMVEPSRAQTVDTEITRHCAYNIPAVAYTLGRQNWHCIKHLYETLSQAMQWKVRRTLAFSIHELAVIVGEEITHQDLLPVFDGFLKDLDEVRIGVLKHLADFLKLLRPDVRQRYLSKLSDFMKTDNHRNWRFRQELAEQLILLCDLFTPHDIVKRVAPLGIALCMDKVSEVRLVSFGLVSAILRHIHEGNEEPLLQGFSSELIDKFALSTKWLGRQIYGQLCQSVLDDDALPPPVFAQHLMPALLALGNDPVPNVRLTLAKVLATRVVPLEYFTSGRNPHHEELIATLHRLQSDKDRDVRFFSCQQADSETSISVPHAYDTVSFVPQFIL
ncbi:hypothetical protein BaRGS_00002932, partial [Batillaria attramentaria]